MISTTNGINLTILQHGNEVEVTFLTEEAIICVSTLKQQQAKLLLRQDIQKHKQLLELKSVFDLFDVDGSEHVDEHELVALLQTLGQNMHPSEISHKIKEFDTDNSGNISFVSAHAIRQLPVISRPSLTDCL